VELTGVQNDDSFNIFDETSDTFRAPNVRDLGMAIRNQVRQHGIIGTLRVLDHMY